MKAKPDLNGVTRRALGRDAFDSQDDLTFPDRAKSHQKALPRLADDGNHCAFRIASS